MFLFEHNYRGCYLLLKFFYPRILMTGSLRMYTNVGLNQNESIPYRLKGVFVKKNLNILCKRRTESRQQTSFYVIYHSYNTSSFPRIEVT